MAQVIARAAARDLKLGGAEFRSAGTSAIPGNPASQGALQAAERHGLNLEFHRAASLSGDLIEWADLILTMGPAHLIKAVELGGEGKSHLLGEFAGGSERGATDLSVPDPYGGGDEIYEATFRTLQDYVTRALGRLAGGKGRS